MPFPVHVKERLFVKGARLCCLCLKQCGTNIEVAHIDQEADGGSNDEDNGIPVCMDCHTEIGHYNDHHPKGNKFRPGELRSRRDHIFKLVETGVIFAQIIAQRSRAGHTGTQLPPIPETTTAAPSRDGQRLLKQFLEMGDHFDSPGGRFGFLDPLDRAFILDELVNRASQLPIAARILMRICRSSSVTNDESRIIRERTVREAVLLGYWNTKIPLLEEVSPEDFASLPENLRLALFEEFIEVIEQDQWEIVNKLVPAIVPHHAAVPAVLHEKFVATLLKQGSSSSFDGAPAARRILASMNEGQLRAGLNVVTKQFLIGRGHMEGVRSFVKRLLAVAEGKQKKMLQCFADSPKTFMERYCPED